MQFSHQNHKNNIYFFFKLHFCLKDINYINIYLINKKNHFWRNIDKFFKVGGIRIRIQMKRIRNTAKKYISCRGEVNTAIMLDLVGIGDEVGLSTGLNICSKYDIISPYPIFKKIIFFSPRYSKNVPFFPFCSRLPLFIFALFLSSFTGEGDLLRSF